ncbi:hypothetical protein PPL_06054 [Heterostelium album PN500]|uniref:PH domain-containing protein n=1 Tax=Heterostelium pallidum (strain ATCC 26659 / Pp 5 / PN500) TaxID=670386 RepID=D3BC32_HETP5|nr:hypothetical protein PPL_06054 [Heterostelium album PN500]EFA81215.1 hypothetical protein PPL_06054 [Heterostelium album PN500]|eukprot:XP_020433333.1 hypothetical protein PPL_06054 [Heterostelium album PN500]
MPSALQGYLFKLGVKGVLKLYKKRWCILPENEDVLYYYTSKVELKLCGSIKLREILHTSVSKNSALNSGSTWGFELTTPGRVYSVYASSEQDRIYWIEGITARINIIKKKADDPSSNPVVHDGTPQKIKLISSYTGNNNTANSSSPTAQMLLELLDSDDGGSSESSISKRSREKQLEKENEVKDNLIEKLEEEKQAFAKYAKELEEEKQALQSENDKILQKLEESNDLERYQLQIKQLEKEREEMTDDLKALEGELEEERNNRMKLLSEKQSMQMNFSQEKNDLIQKAEDSESGKKKAIELMQSGQYLRPNENQLSNKKKYNWPKVLISIDRHIFQYRKQRDSYFIVNINLRRFLDESLRASGKYDNPLIRFRDGLDVLEKYLKSFERNGEVLEKMVAIVKNEIKQCLGFVVDGQKFTDENDSELESFVDLMAVREISETDSLLMDKKSLKYPLDKLSTELQALQISHGQTEMDQFSESYEQWSQLYDKGEQRIKRCMEIFKKVAKETESSPVYLESADPFDLKIETLLNRLEPYLEEDSTNNIAQLIDNPDELNEKAQSLVTELQSQTQQLKNDFNKSTGYQSECQEVLMDIDKQTELTSNELEEPIAKHRPDIQKWHDQRSDMVVQIQKIIIKLLELKKKMILIRSLSELQSKGGVEYVANENDQLDIMVESVIHSLHNDDDEIRGLIPPNFQRVSEGLYQFGSRRINTSILSGNLVVRVGGGFQTFEEFVHKYGRSETIKILRQSSNSASLVRSTHMTPDKRFQSHIRFGSVLYFFRI